MNVSVQFRGFKSLIGMAAALALGAGVTMAYGDDAPAAPPTTGHHQRPADTQPGAAGLGHKVMEQLLQGINLTDDQKTQIKTMAEAFGQSFKDWQAQNQDQLKTLRGQIQAAHQAKDRATVQQLLGQIKTLRESAPKLKDLADKIRGVLTTDQVTTFDKNVQTVMGEIESRVHQNHPGAPGTQPAGGSASKA